MQPLLGISLGHNCRSSAWCSHMMIVRAGQRPALLLCASAIQAQNSLFLFPHVHIVVGASFFQLAMSQHHVHNPWHARPKPQYPSALLTQPHPPTQTASTEQWCCSCLQSMLGEGASVVLEGQKVISSRTQDAGFKFRYSFLQDALLSVR